MDLLSASVEEKPYNEPGIVHRLDDAYFKKIDAIELRLNMMMVKILKDYLKLILFYLVFRELQRHHISVFSA